MKRCPSPGPALRALSGVAMLATVGLLQGCASGSPQNVIFVTKTSFGVDMAAQPSGASVGYDRVEGYIGPRGANGYVPPVTASFLTNGHLVTRQIRQVYATGDAARIVTATDPSTVKAEADLEPSESNDVMFFVTGTTMGLKLAFGPAGVTDYLTFGYKRRELSVIPITKAVGGRFPSVLATLETDQDAATREGVSVGVGQYFATGAAARSVAGDEDVRRLFKHRVQSALTTAEYAEKRQAETALSTLTCFTQLGSAELPRVYADADRRKLFAADASPAVAKWKDLPEAESRPLYTRMLAASDGQSATRGAAMALHRDLVCALAGR